MTPNGGGAIQYYLPPILYDIYEYWTCDEWIRDMVALLSTMNMSSLTQAQLDVYLLERGFDLSMPLTCSVCDCINTPYGFKIEQE